MEDNLFDIFKYLGIEVTNSQKTVQKAINSLDLKKKAALNNNAKYSKIRDWIFNERLNQEFLKYVNAIRLLRGANNNQNQMEDNLFDIFKYLGIEVTDDQETVQNAINRLNLNRKAALDNNAKYSKIRDWIFNERLNQDFLKYVDDIRLLRGAKNNQNQPDTNQTHSKNNGNSDGDEEWIIFYAPEFDDLDAQEEGVPDYVPEKPIHRKPIERQNDERANKSKSNWYYPFLQRLKELLNKYPTEKISFAFIWSKTYELLRRLCSLIRQVLTFISPKIIGALRVLGSLTRCAFAFLFSILFQNKGLLFRLISTLSFLIYSIAVKDGELIHIAFFLLVILTPPLFDIFVLVIWLALKAQMVISVPPPCTLYILCFLKLVIIGMIHSEN